VLADVVAPFVSAVPAARLQREVFGPEALEHLL